jgi:RNA polymerase sigma-70 factor (ECF subfamily)
MPEPLRPRVPLAPGASFEEVVIPHLDAAFRLARWLTRNEHDARDVVQDASLRALRYFRTFTGGDGRAWFLRIVRNTCSTWHRRRVDALMDTFDERRHLSASPGWTDPETLLTRADDATQVVRALQTLPDKLHHLLVLREFDGLSYRELADEIGAPIGTVMSRLSRGRDALRNAFKNELKPSRVLATTETEDEKPDAVLA